MNRNDESVKALRSVLGGRLYDIWAYGWIATDVPVREFVLSQETLVMKIGDQFLNLHSSSGSPISVSISTSKSYGDFEEFGENCTVSLKHLLLYTADMEPRIKKISVFYLTINHMEGIFGLLFDFVYSGTESLFVEADIVDGLHSGGGSNADRWRQWWEENNQQYSIVELEVISESV